MPLFILNSGTSESGVLGLIRVHGRLSTIDRNINTDQSISVNKLIMNKRIFLRPRVLAIINGNIPGQILQKNAV